MLMNKDLVEDKLNEALIALINLGAMDEPIFSSLEERFISSMDSEEFEEALFALEELADEVLADVNFWEIMQTAADELSLIKKSKLYSVYVLNA